MSSISSGAAARTPDDHRGRLAGSRPAKTIIAESAPFEGGHGAGTAPASGGAAFVFPRKAAPLGAEP